MVSTPVALEVQKGTCYALFAYEIGLAIKLDQCEQLVSPLTQRERLRHKRRAPRYFDYRPPPLRVLQEAGAIVLDGRSTAETVDLVLYDFGAISVTYSIPLAGPLAGLLDLSEALYENAALLADSRRRVEQLIAAIDAAVVRPRLADFVESYAIFHVEAFNESGVTQALYTTYAAAIAQILRSERATLSASEVNDALAQRISYGADDIAIIDWDAAVLFDREPDDVRAVLEFANAELLEMRFLDQQLDDALDESYEALSKRQRRFHIHGSSHRDLRRVAQLQVDNAILFEGVNNALKLIGDQYLARVYRLASDRFHLAEWDGSILRKLQTLESIYEKMSDAAANQRLELLEWVIIVLSAISVLLYFLPGLIIH